MDGVGSTLRKLREYEDKFVIHSSLCLRWGTSTRIRISEAAQKMQPSLSDDCMHHPPNQFLTILHLYCRIMVYLSWHLSILI